MPPTPQPSTPRPLTIVVCESVPTTVSGNADHELVLLFSEDDAREIFEIYLMADARIGRDDFEILEALLPPPEEGIALKIALHFEAGIEGERVRCAEFIDLNGMVDHEFSGEQGIDFRCVAT